MAYAQSTRTATPGIADRIHALFTAAQEALGRRRVYRQTLNELNALTDRELADLGIARSMISRIAIEAAEGK